jgi:hypothetical protein
MHSTWRCRCKHVCHLRRHLRAIELCCLLPECLERFLLCLKTLIKTFQKHLFRFFSTPFMPFLSQVPDPSVTVFPFDRSAFITNGTALGQGGGGRLWAKGLQGGEVRDSPSVRGRQCPVGEGRRSFGGWVGDARGDRTCGREGCRMGCKQDRGQ